MGKLYHALITQPKRDMVQAFSGNAKTLEGFKKNLGNIKKKGYVNYPDGATVALTEKGIAYVGTDVDPSSITNETIHETFKELLPGNKGKLIFEAISDGHVHQKKDIAVQLGYDLTKLSGYEKDLSKMSTLEFINKTKTTIQLTDKCFPLGR